jgi:hypothetical protein
MKTHWHQNCATGKEGKILSNLLIGILSGILLLYIAWGLFCWRLSIARANNPAWLELDIEETDQMVQELVSSQARG